MAQGISEASTETPKDASAPVVARHAATLNALPFSDTRDFDDAARGFLGTVEHARITNPQGRVVWSLEPYGFLSDEKAPATVDPEPVAAVAAQHEPRAVRGGARRLSGARPRHRQHDADRRRYRRHRGRYPDLDRRRARGDGAVFPAPRQASGRGGDLHPHPYRPLGRRPRRDRRRDAGERQRADHRAQSFHGARGLRKHHRGPCDAAARAISVRAVPGQGRARAGRLRARQVDGGGLGGAVAPDRPDHGDRRQAHHRRARIRIPDGAELRGAGGNALFHSALQAVEPRGKLHAQFPQSAAVPRRRRARRAGLVEISRRSPADVGRQGRRDVRPAPLAGVGHRAHRHHDPPAARSL